MQTSASLITRQFIAFTFNKGLVESVRYVAQAFQPAGSGDFPVSCSCSHIVSCYFNGLPYEAPFFHSALDVRCSAFDALLPFDSGAGKDEHDARILSEGG